MRRWIPWLLLATGFASGILVSEGARLLKPKRLGCELVGKSASAEVEKVRQLTEIVVSLKKELVDLSDCYPELAEMKTCPVGIDGLRYFYHCSYGGKGGYSDLGSNPVAVNFTLMSESHYNQASSGLKQMRMAQYQWPSLNLVGWAEIHLGDKPNEALSCWSNLIIARHVGMIDELERLASQSAAKPNNFPAVSGKSPR
jgi:hypothetical protein